MIRAIPSATTEGIPVIRAIPSAMTEGIPVIRAIPSAMTEGIPVIPVDTFLIKKKTKLITK